MSRKASPVLIGAFVIAGVALLVVGVLVFGGREIFQRKQRFVTYFEGSVQGLRVGADVQFRGVRIGYVTDIQVVADASLTNYQIPVIFEILPDAVTVASGGAILGDLGDANSRLKGMINAGLRTRLRTAIKNVRKAIAAGDAEAADKALRAEMSVIDSVADKRIIHKNKASRHKSRLAQQVKALGKRAA